MSTRTAAIVARIRARSAEVAAAVSLRDVHIYGGLALAAAGGWHFNPAGTCVGLGITLALLGILVPRRGRER